MENEMIRVMNKNRLSELLDESHIIKLDSDDGLLEKQIAQNYISRLDFDEKLFLILESMDPEFKGRYEGLQLVNAHVDFRIEYLRQYSDNKGCYDDLLDLFEFLETDKKGFIGFLEALHYASEMCGR